MAQEILNYSDDGQDAQVILHYSDGQDNLEIFVTPVFSIEELTTREYKEEVREHIHALLLNICQTRGYNTQNPNRNHTFNIPELMKEITLHAPDGNATFSWFIHKEGYCCTPLKLEDLVDDYLYDEQVLDTFDKWARNMRERIENLLKGGNMTIGTTIEFPDELEYFTEFPMGLPKNATNILKHSKYSPSSTEYSGTI